MQGSKLVMGCGGDEGRREPPPVAAAATMTRKC